MYTYFLIIMIVRANWGDYKLLIGTEREYKTGEGVESFCVSGRNLALFVTRKSPNTPAVKALIFDLDKLKRIGIDDMAALGCFMAKEKQFRMMWLLLLALFWSIVFVSSKPTRPIERHRWVENTAREEMLGPYLQKRPDHYGMFLPKSIDKSYSDMDMDDLIFQQPSQKRALTMFGRWGPINELGKERSSIRSTDRIHPSTGRKMGQPFRWG